MRRTTSNNRVLWWAGGGAAILLGAALIVVLSGGPVDGGLAPMDRLAPSVVAAQTSPPPKDSDGGSAAPTPRAIDAWDLASGGVGRYRIAGELWMTETGVLTSEGRVRFEGDWELAPRTADSSDPWVVGQLDRLKVTGEVASFDKGAFGRLGEEQGPYHVALRLGSSGEVEEHRFSPNTPSGVRSATEMLVVGMKTVRAPDDAALTSVRAEEVPGGTMDVSYVKEDEVTLAKRWGQGLQSALERTSWQAGSSLLTFDALGLTAMDFTCVVNTDVTWHKRVPHHFQVGFRAQSQRTALVAGDWVTGVDLNALLTGEQIAGKTEKPEALPAPTPRALGVILEEAAEATVKGEAIERSRLSMELRVNVSASLPVLGQVLTMLKTPGLQGGALMTLVEGLAYATSDAAKIAYAKALLDPSLPRLARFSLVAAAATIEEPTPQVLDAIRTCAKDPACDVRSQAALVWGTIASLELDSNPSLGAYLRNELLATAAPSLLTNDATPDPGPDTGLWIRALGNLGGVEVWPMVAPWLSSNDDLVRGFALRTLRFVPVAAARQALAEAIREEPDHRNRSEALTAAMYQPRAAMEKAVKRAMREDSDSAVRLDAGYLVAHWGLTSPGLYAEIKDAALHEIKPEVKEGLLGLLPKIIKDDESTNP